MLRFPLMQFRRISLVTCAAVFAATLLAAEANNLAWLESRFAELDRNHDGKLTSEESGGAAWFDRLDRRGAGFVTLEEIRTLARRFGRTEATVPIAPADTVTATPPAAAAPQASPREGPKVLRPADHGIGRLIPDVAFTDIDGKPGRLSDFRSAKFLVIALTSTTCPVTKKYAPSLARISQDFAAKNVAFLFVNPTATDAVADIRAVLAENALAGRMVRDRDQHLASALAAQTTAEVFVLDAARTLLYRGAVDDQYGLGYALDAPRVTYLRAALSAALAGKSVAVTATAAPGCALDLAPIAPLTPAASAAHAATVTYHNRVSRIIQQNCLECHRDGGVAPFSLATYEDVRSHAGMMRKQVSRGAMPPWFAAPPAAGESSHWKNDRSLAASDKADLLAWLAGDKPIGDPADAPLPRTFPSGWLIGAPDLVLEFPRAVAIKADGVMPYQTIRVETKLTADRWVQAYEVLPSAREVVHHVIVRVHAPGAKARAEKDDGADERDGFFAAYVPGNTHATFPPGFAKKIPAGATLSFQMHYTPNGKATADRTKIGLIFAAEPPRHVIRVAGLANPRLNIPPGAPNHPETATLRLPFDTTILSFVPHMHLRGKAARYEAILADGTRRVLLDVPAYDFNWQLPYQFAEPVTLPRGTRLVYTAWYDNSAGNPANPDPAKNVRWGPQTYDEMMLGYVEYYVPGRALAAAEPR
jgi:thiol-disulfide isomerase/thioredoxin/mono/diheme cytochrome c family protein